MAKKPSESEKLLQQQHDEASGKSSADRVKDAYSAAGSSSSKKVKDGYDEAGSNSAEKVDEAYALAKGDVDLDSAEKRATKSDDSDNGLYSPKDEEQITGIGLLRRFSLKKKGVIGGTAGIIASLIIIVFPIIMGPLQFIHIAQTLIPGFEGSDDIGHRSSSRIMRYLWHGDAVERSRLGAIGNRVADSVEARLRADGIEVHLDPVTRNMDGMTIKGEFHPLESGRFKNQRGRIAFRDAMYKAGYGKITTAIVSRPLFDRYNIKLKWLGNLRRQPGEEFAKWKARWQAADEAEIKDGSSDTRVASADDEKKALEEELKAAEEAGDTDRQAEIKDKINDIETSRGAVDEGSTLKQAVEDTPRKPDGTFNYAEAKSKLLGDIGVGKGSALAMVAGMSVCFVRNIAIQAPKLEYVNKWLPSIRTAMKYVSIGFQMMTGQDVDGEELEFLAEKLVDSEGRSWAASDQILEGGIPTPPEIKVGKAAGSGWVKAGEAVDFPMVDEVCTAMGDVRVQVGLTVTEIFLGGGIISTLAVEGAQEAFSRFIVGPFGESLIRSIAGLEITEQVGPGLGSVMALGVDYVEVMKGQALGGTTLSPVEATDARNYMMETNPELYAEKGFYDKFLNPELPDSTVGSLAMASYKIVGKGAAIDFNPVNLLSGLFSEIGSLFTGKLSAEGGLADSGVDKVGFTAAELQRMDETDPFAIAEYLVEKYGSEEKLDEEFGDCLTKAPDPEGEIEPNYYEVNNLCDGDSGEKTVNESDLLDYRLYRYVFEPTLLALGCYSGEQVSCDDLGVPDELNTLQTTDSSGESTFTGLISPLGLASSPDQSDGYYRMPDSPDTSYTWNGGTPRHSQCGTKTLIDVIYTVAKRWSVLWPQNLMKVGDLNEEDGHASHNNGVDVDIFMNRPVGGTYSFATTEDAKALGRMFADTNLIKVILYNDPAVIADFNSYVKANGLNGEMKYWEGHGNHFHLRILDEFEGTYSAGCTDGK